MHCPTNPINYLQTLTATSKLPALFHSPLSSSSSLGFNHLSNPNYANYPLSLSVSFSSISTHPKSIYPIPSSTSSSSNSILCCDCSGNMDSLVQVAHSVADVAGKVLRKYFRQRFDIIDKDDRSMLISPSFFIFIVIFVFLFIFLSFI